MIKDNDKNSGQIPPYSSFKGFKKLMEQFRERPENLPESIQASVLRGFSGFDKSALLGSLRWFGLIDEARRPTDKLRALVAASEDEYVNTLRKLIIDSYDKVVSIEELKSITAETLQDRISENGSLTGSTVAKAISFLVSACGETGIEVSQYIISGSISVKPKSRKASQKRSSKRGRDKKQEETPIPSTPKVDADSESPDMVKIEIPLPGRPAGKIYLPNGMEKAEWNKAIKMIRSILDIYTESEDTSDEKG